MHTYREQAPPASLARWVECSWNIATGTAALVGYPVRPDGCLDIVFDRQQGLRAVGAMTAEKRHDFHAGLEVLGIRFRPGMAAAFLRTPPPVLTDAIVSLADLWGSTAREVEGRISEAASSQERAQELWKVLSLPHQPPTPIERAIEAMTVAHGMVDLDEIARQANLSVRQFRRRCLEASGLTPKHLCRILRFRHALELAGRDGRPGWPDIAIETGYFDQAHLIRDFHEFTGTTPMSVFSNTTPA